MTPWLEDQDVTLYLGDALEVLRGLPDGSAGGCVTSPPYLDARPEYPSPTPREFDTILAELARVVDGPVLVNVGRLWRKGAELLWWVDLLQSAPAHGLELLDTLVWIKPNANPIHGRFLANSHEYVFVLGGADAELQVDEVRRPHADSTRARFGRAWTNHRGVKQPQESRARKTRAELNPLGARPRSYVAFHVGREKGNPHPAPMALELAEHLVRLACPPGGTVLDPFAGSGTTGVAARRHSRRAVLVELSEAYCRLVADRLSQQSLLTEGAA